MLNKTSLAAALSLAIALPFGASAATLNPGNTIVDGGIYNMVGAYFFGEAFQKEDVAGTREFTFTNSSAVSQNLLLSTATVNTLSGMFAGGITFEWLQSGASLFVAQRITNFSDSLNTMIGANGSDTLRITFGDPRRRDTSQLDDTAAFNVAFDGTTVAAVPLPAGGLLLISAMAGIAALRRRRMAA